MHTLATIGFLAIGLFAAAVIFWELRRKRHYIAYLFRYFPDDAPKARTNWWEVYYTGLLIAYLVILFLVRP